MIRIILPERKFANRIWLAHQRLLGGRNTIVKREENPLFPFFPG